MNDTFVLNIGGEANGDLVEVTAEDRSIPDRGSIKDIDSAGDDGVGGNIRVHGDVREDVMHRNNPALPTIVPLHVPTCIQGRSGIVGPEGSGWDIAAMMMMMMSAAQ